MLEHETGELGHQCAEARVLLQEADDVMIDIRIETVIVPKMIPTTILKTRRINRFNRRIHVTHHKHP